MPSTSSSSTRRAAGRCRPSCASFATSSRLTGAGAVDRFAAARGLVGSKRRTTALRSIIVLPGTLPEHHPELISAQLSRIQQAILVALQLHPVVVDRGFGLRRDVPPREPVMPVEAEAPGIRRSRQRIEHLRYIRRLVGML